MKGDDDEFSIKSMETTFYEGNEQTFFTLSLLLRAFQKVPV